MPSANLLIDGLSASTRERLQPYTEFVHLAKGRLLADVDDVIRQTFFPVGGRISALALTESGDTIELAAIGNDGFTGVTVALGDRVSPHRLVVQIAGGAYRIPVDVVQRELQRSVDFQRAALHVVQRLLTQVTQSAMCLTFHPLPQRLCRWLLACYDGTQSNTIELTHEFLAQMLGVSRPKVSQALILLEAQHLIHQGHARIHLADRHGLERASCACYRRLRVREPLRVMR